MKKIILTFCFLFYISSIVYAENIKIIHTGNTQGLSSSFSYEISKPYFLLLDYVKQKGSIVKDFRVSSSSMYFYHKNIYIWGKNLGIKEFRQLLSKKNLGNIRKTRELEILSSEDAVTFEMSESTFLIDELKSIINNKDENKYNINLKKSIFL